MANIFEQFNNCLKNKDYQESLGFNSFMFCRFLGSSPKTLKQANLINMLYKNLNDKTQYDIIRFSPNKPTFIKFLSQNPKENQQNVEELIHKYKISKEKALEYLEILNLKVKNWKILEIGL